MSKSTRRELARYRWYGMIRRCTNPTDKNFKHYGARGIKVCPRWLASFDAYYTDTGDSPHEGASIDRIDNDGDYACGHCEGEQRNWRWATVLQQRHNQRNFMPSACVHGHAFDLANTYVSPTGERACRKCQTASKARSRARARALQDAS